MPNMQSKNQHRAYWRDLYTVEEADHLSSLIAAAKEQGIVFYYALSPGLDMSYSNQKEVHTLKRKLEQVSQFGCEAFALLFDDIEAELSKADKEVFQTFANAQVSVTNEIFTHLNNPRFLFCPKLYPDIDIMWTGTCRHLKYPVQSQQFLQNSNSNSNNSPDNSPMGNGGETITSYGSSSTTVKKLIKSLNSAAPNNPMN